MLLSSERTEIMEKFIDILEIINNDPVEERRFLNMANNIIKGRYIESTLEKYIRGEAIVQND